MFGYLLIISIIILSYYISNHIRRTYILYAITNIQTELEATNLSYIRREILKNQLESLIFLYNN